MTKIPQWQEAYMDRLNRQYWVLLSGEGDPSDKFWALEKRIRRDKRSPGVLVELRRSKMLHALLGFCRTCGRPWDFSWGDT